MSILFFKPYVPCRISHFILLKVERDAKDTCSTIWENNSSTFNMFFSRIIFYNHLLTPNSKAFIKCFTESFKSIPFGFHRNNFLLNSYFISVWEHSIKVCNLMTSTSGICRFGNKPVLGMTQLTPKEQVCPGTWRLLLSDGAQSSGTGLLHRGLWNVSYSDERGMWRLVENMIYNNRYKIHIIAYINKLYIYWGFHIYTTTVSVRFLMFNCLVWLLLKAVFF